MDELETLIELNDEPEGVVPAALAHHYEARDDLIKTKGPEAARASLEMWTALLEIAQAQSWRARFHSQNSWIDYLTDLNIYGLSRANIMAKIRVQRDLITANASPTMAAIAAAVIPAASEELNTAGKMKQAAGDTDPDDYLAELLTLPSPGEAVKRVKTDKGNNATMWIQDLHPLNNKLLGQIVREDSRGYAAYDFVLTIMPRDNQPLDGLHDWLMNILRGKHV